MVKPQNCRASEIKGLYFTHKDLIHRDSCQAQTHHLSWFTSLLFLFPSRTEENISPQVVLTSNDKQTNQTSVRSHKECDACFCTLGPELFVAINLLSVSGQVSYFYCLPRQFSEIFFFCGISFCLSLIFWLFGLSSSCQSDVQASCSDQYDSVLSVNKCKTLTVQIWNGLSDD